MQHRITYLSFWNVQLSSLPVGAFRKRALSRDEARTVVDSSRASGTLICVAKDDLGAPYCERERERHRQLCVALRENAGLEIQLKDFFGRNCANPLCTAVVGTNEDLLVIDCAYAVTTQSGLDTASADVLDFSKSFRPNARRLGHDALGLHIAPESLKFYLFEQIERGPTP